MCRKLALLSVLCALAGCVNLLGQTLVWDPNSESDLAGYRVYRGDASRNYSVSVDVGNTTSYPIPALSPGVWYFAVTAYNTSGLESGFSNEVSTRIEADSTPPVLTSRAARVLTNSGATITLTTNEDATARIEYGTSAQYGSVLNTSTLAQSQSLRLTGLAAATTYHYRTIITDSSGNVFVSQDATFTTAPSPESIIPVHVSGYPHPVADTPFVGFGVTNIGKSPSGLRLTAFDAGGMAVAGPVSVLLAPGEQITALDSQIFGDAISASTVAWVKVESSSEDISGLFFGLNDGPTKMDGGALQSSGSSEFILPGSGAFVLFNPHVDPSVATLQLVGADGRGVSAVQRIIPADGALSTSAALLFPTSSVAASDYLEVNTTQDLLSFAATLDTAEMLGIVPGLDARTYMPVVYAPDFIGGAGWHSTIAIVNTDSLPGSLTVRLFADDGTPISAPSAYDVPGRGIIRITEQELIHSEPGKAVRGYVEISTNVALAGALTIEFNGRAASAFRLINTPRQAFVIGHVASDSNYYTGAALLNPALEPVSVALELHLSDGTLAGTWNGILSPRQRVVQLMTQYFPGIADKDMTTGYVRVVADRDIVVLALFGRNDLSVLSAIPPE